MALSTEAASEPNQSEFHSLNDWLLFLHSADGVQNAGGGIDRYAVAEEIDDLDLSEEVRHMTSLFRPLMERIVADAPPATASPPEIQVPVAPPPSISPVSFSKALSDFLRELEVAQRGPFQKTDALWNAMSDVKTRIEQFAAVQSRPSLLVNISVGQGNWADRALDRALEHKDNEIYPRRRLCSLSYTTELDRVFSP